MGQLEITLCDFKFDPRRPAHRALTFTEQGVALLSSVLGSQPAVAVYCRRLRAGIEVLQRYRSSRSTTSSGPLPV